MSAYRSVARRSGGICAILIVSLAIAWTTCALATEPRVLLMRGWFNVFSTGMDDLADKLRAKGINAEVKPHTYWDTALAEILRERADGKIAPIVLIGHSQGANNAVVLAHSLKAHQIPVDMLITLAPFMQDVIPSNVVRAINYYQSPGWGSPLVPGPGFHGKITNNDLSSDLAVFHITIDKTSKIHEAIIRDVANLQAQPFVPSKPASVRAHAPGRPLSYAPTTR
jgi:hypothetical protein